jgi:hypothetical protein
MATDLAPVAAPVGVPRLGVVRLVDVAPRRVLLIDGRGAPASTAFQGAIEALFSLAYTIRFGPLRERGDEGHVGPLEGLFDLEAGDPETDFVPWTLMIGVPATVTAADVASALEIVRRRRNVAGLDRVRLETVHEGLCAEILHVGPYAAEGPTINRLHSVIEARGYRLHGRHHEIYVGDPRRAAPERLRTVIRQPIL